MRRALAVLLVLAVAPVAAAPASAATKVKRYQAWTADGEPLIKRWFHGSAECAGASRVDARPDAWRCVSGTIALDPCFASPTDDEVLCLTAPWARRGHLLSAVLNEDGPGASPARGPWALVVAKRRRCTRIAPRARGRGRRATYRCGRRGFLFGRPATRRKTWTIRFARNRKGRGARRVKVRQAWT